ncbi:MAG: hypothetical protein KC425_11125 [Anaerolineales bacterium]|nr:hypothetical protein [Anaerolineales bacterium]
MRRRTLILAILVVVVAIVAVVLVLANRSGGLLNSTADNGGDGVDTTTVDETGEAQEPGIPTPEPTPAVRFDTVVVARVDLPAGQRLIPELLEIQTRPNTNIALQGGYTFSTIEELVGAIVRVDVSEGQEILSPMIALNATDLSAMGSDLSTYIEQGSVAIAFPLRYQGESVESAAVRGAAFAMRPGDFVDVMMTLNIVEIDPEFRTALPNNTQRVIQSALLEGQAFLFDTATQGRLQLIPEINQVAEIIPGSSQVLSDVDPGRPIPKRTTQLTIQQAEVLWVGTWRTQEALQEELAPTPVPIVTDDTGAGLLPEEETAVVESETEETGPLCLSPTTNQLIPCPVVRESSTPDMVILSMSSQDALILKWAMDRNVEINLALRAQGDRTVFFTTSVSLPQIVNEGGLAVPAEASFDLVPRADETDIPTLPDQAPIE